LGAVLFAFGLILLLAITWGRWLLVTAAVVYSLAAVSLFVSSSFYHAFKKRDDQINIWRRLDHIAIFLMIAGSYTPVVLVYLDGAWRFSMIILPWFFAVAGVLVKVFYLKAPRILSVGLYLVMGWLAVIPMIRLWQTMPLTGFVLMVCGGLAYSLGALVYLLKKPDPRPGRFGFHDIFHLFVLLGAGLHYVMVFMALSSS